MTLAKTLSDYLTEHPGASVNLSFAALESQPTIIATINMTHPGLPQKIAQASVNVSTRYAKSREGLLDQVLSREVQRCIGRVKDQAAHRDYETERLP